MINYIIGGVAILIVLSLFRKLIKKGRGKSTSCSCGCSGCSSINQCGYKK